MARPLRLEHAGALWHVTCRGNERRSIFRDDGDRKVFLGLLAEAISLFSWRLHAYVLMGNHYHLLLETPEPNLSRGMHRLNSIYSQLFNKRHQRVGHLLQGRFHAILIEKERHLLELVRYLVLNPVRAGIVGSARDWPWSNFLATAGLRPAPAWLETSWTVDQFGRGEEARRAYADFVAAGAAQAGRPWREVAGQLFLGGEEFRRRAIRLAASCLVDPDVPLPQRRAVRWTLEDVARASASVLGVDPRELVKQRRTPLRLAVAYLGRTDALASLSEIGNTLDVTPSAAGGIVASARRLHQQTAEFRSLLRRIRAELRGFQA
jgi:REP element-mobilizing transposase RayT